MARLRFIVEMVGSIYGTDARSAGRLNTGINSWNLRPLAWRALGGIPSSALR